MKRIALLLPVAALMLFAPAARAQQDTTRISLGDAITTAIANNRQIALSRLAIDNAGAQVDEAYSGTRPSVTLNGRYTRNIQRPVFFFPGNDGISRPISVGSDNAFSADVSVNQVLYNAAAFTAPDAAKSYVTISQQQLRGDVAQTVLDLKRAYFGALLAREALRVNNALLVNSEENLKNAQQLFKAGLRPEFDALRAEVQAANQRPMVAQARDAYQQALDNLKLLLGYTQDHPIALTDDLARPTAGENPPAYEQAAATLAQSNAQVQTLKSIAEVNRQLIEIKRSDYLPTVSLFGTYQLQAQSDNFSNLSFQPTSYVGLNLTFNIYGGGKTDAQVEQARLAFEQSNVKTTQAEEALKTQLGIVLRRIDVARQRMTSADMTITQAERAYTIATTSYKAGTGTQLVINDADLALAQSRLNLLNAVYDYHIALSELEQLLGDRYQLEGRKDVKYSVR